MLFDLRPKERLKDLFDRRDEYGELGRQLEAGSWVAVLGKRMTGKTSLVKTYARENGGVYVNLLGVRGLEGFVSRLAEQGGFRLEGLEARLGFIGLSWSRVGEGLFSTLGSKVVVLDEVQSLASPHFLRFLKAVWDSYRVRFVFTGSYIGVLRSLLEPGSSSPLYGRSPFKLVLRPFTREEARSFLHSGFREVGVEVGDGEVEEVVERLGGYVGWLTYYGNFRCFRNMSHREALAEAVREGTKIAYYELKSFLENRNKPLYAKALRAILNGARWSDVKRATGANSKVVSEILWRLKAATLVDEEEGLYRVDDPMTRQAIKMLR